MAKDVAVAFKVDGDSYRELERYAEQNGYKSPGTAARALALAGVQNGTDEVMLGRLAERIADEVAYVSSRGTLASLGMLMMACARQDTGAASVLDGLNAAEAYEVAYLMGKMSLGQDAPDFYKLVSPALRTMRKSQRAKDALLDQMAKLDSREVLFAMDRDDLKPWLYAMREWRALANMPGDLPEDMAHLRREVRATMLSILAEMDVGSTEHIWMFSSGQVFERGTGWFDPSDTERTRRRARVHGDYIAADANDPNFIAAIEVW